LPDRPAPILFYFATVLGCWSTFDRFDDMSSSTSSTTSSVYRNSEYRWGQRAVAHLPQQPACLPSFLPCCICPRLLVAAFCMVASFVVVVWSCGVLLRRGWVLFVWKEVWE
jgi:hypothetical protein